MNDTKSVKTDPFRGHPEEKEEKFATARRELYEESERLFSLPQDVANISLKCEQTDGCIFFVPITLDGGDVQVMLNQFDRNKAILNESATREGGNETLGIACEVYDVDPTNLNSKWPRRSSQMERLVCVIVLMFHFDDTIGLVVVVVVRKRESAPTKHISKRIIL